jgi:hypothetical protein
MLETSHGTRGYSCPALGILFRRPGQQTPVKPVTQDFSEAVSGGWHGRQKVESEQRMLAEIDSKKCVWLTGVRIPVPRPFSVGLKDLNHTNAFNF